MESLNVKIFVSDGHQVKDIRRFSIAEDVCTSFEYLDGKIRSVVSDLLRKDLHISWQDEDGDQVTISCDEEFNMAVHSIPTGQQCLKLYVKVKSKPTAQSEHNEEHPGVTCDGCNTSLRGFRYKCLECPDFDLCSTCMRNGGHPEHDMICIRKHKQGRPQCFAFPYGGGFGFQNRRGCGGPWGPGGPWAGPGIPLGGKKCRREEKWANKAKKGDFEFYEKKAEKFANRLAAAFGLDPEVAQSHVKEIVAEMRKQCNEMQKENSKEGESKMETDEQEQQKPESSTENQPEPQEAEQTNPPQKVEDIMADFGRSLGMNPEMFTQGVESLMRASTQPGEQGSVDQAMHENPYAALNLMMQQLFKERTERERSQASSAAHSDGQSTSDQGPQVSDEASHAESTGPTQSRSWQPETLTDFVVVKKETPANGSHVQADGATSIPTQSQSPAHQPINIPDAKMTEEQRFHQRLDVSLKQMEAMGFDNEGGWLSQLLIAKQLNVAAVIEALNPQ